MHINNIHHVAIICSDIERSKRFYVDLLGFSIQEEHYRENRDSYKVDLEIHGIYQIELFSFKNAPDRLSYPEAKGLRHLAFTVSDIDTSIKELQGKNVPFSLILMGSHSNYTKINAPGIRYQWLNRLILISYTWQSLFHDLLAVLDCLIGIVDRFISCALVSTMKKQ